jgi:carboxymethylenebutenolidase
MFIGKLQTTGIIAALCLSAALLGACGASDDEHAEDGQAASSGNRNAKIGSSANGGTASGGGTQATASRAVISERMPYAELNDELVYGYFVAPSDMFEPLPAVIMIHEWWGLNDDVRAMADRLAAEGFIVLAVDLFGGQTAVTPSSARELMLEVVENPELAEQNMRSAYEFVSNTAGAPRVGAIGWRFGATWSLNTALMYPDDLDATVIYYGPVTDDEEKLRPVNSPILGHFAGKDISIKVASVEAFGAALERLRKDYDIQVYSGARQGFANPTASNYDEVAADDAWQRTVEFLDRHLSDEES